MRYCCWKVGIIFRSSIGSLVSKPLRPSRGRWAAERGVSAALRLASFGGLRGAAAARAVAPGDAVLSIPAAALIYDDSIRQTDLGAMLAAVPGLDAENAMILFTMIDRWDGDSGWAPYWASLPPAFRTGQPGSPAQCPGATARPACSACPQPAQLGALAVQAAALEHGSD